MPYSLANHLAQLVDILKQHVVVRHGHTGKRGCSPRGVPPTRVEKSESSTKTPFFKKKWREKKAY